MRPKTDAKVPAIVAPSPYYTSDCGQFVGECIADVDGDGINDKWPLWYDNYFVPRGYAVILAEMDGTANSTGCAVNGGPSDVQSIKVVIDWLNGRVPGYDSVDGHRAPDPRELAQRQVGADRPLLQRHAAQRRGGDRRRGADDDRPDQRDLVLVRLLADGRRDRLHALSGVPLQLRHRRRRAHPLRADPRHAERAGRRCRRHDERVLGRAQLPPEREQGQGVGVRDALPAGRQRQARPVQRVVGAAGRRTTCRASSGCAARATSTRS